MDEPPRTCEFCGAFAECRPYGPNGEQICFKCGQKDPETTERKMAEYIFPGAAEVLERGQS